MDELIAALKANTEAQDKLANRLGKFTKAVLYLIDTMTPESLDDEPKGDETLDG